MTKKRKDSKWLCGTNGIAGYFQQPNGERIAGVCGYSGVGHPVQCRAHGNLKCVNKVENKAQAYD